MGKSMDDEELLAHIRERMRQIRRVISMAHDPKMIEILEKVVREGEEDIARLEAQRAQIQVKPLQH